MVLRDATGLEEREAELWRIPEARAREHSDGEGCWNGAFGAGLRVAPCRVPVVNRFEFSPLSTEPKQHQRRLPPPDHCWPSSRCSLCCPCCCCKGPNTLAPRQSVHKFIHVKGYLSHHIGLVTQHFTLVVLWRSLPGRESGRMRQAQTQSSAPLVTALSSGTSTYSHSAR
eukprot:1687106-Rhodomonas_salina.1